MCKCGARRTDPPAQLVAAAKAVTSSTARPARANHVKPLPAKSVTAAAAAPVAISSGRARVYLDAWGRVQQPIDTVTRGATRVERGLGENSTDNIVAKMVSIINARPPPKTANQPIQPVSLAVPKVAPQVTAPVMRCPFLQQQQTVRSNPSAPTAPAAKAASLARGFLQAAPPPPQQRRATDPPQSASASASHAQKLRTFLGLFGNN